MLAITRHRRSLVTALLVATGCGLAAGCHSASQTLADNASRAGWPIQDWANVKARPAPQPVAVDHRHDVAFPTGSSQISVTEEDDLKAFVVSAGLGAGDEVYIARVPASDPLSERRRTTLAAFLLLQGVAVASAPSALTAPADATDRLTVVVRRIEVTLPACPDWTAMPNDTFSNRPESFFGCANAVNLGMMVAEPVDLARGREPGTADATVAARAIDRYRRGKTKDLIRDAASGDVFPAEDEGSNDTGSEN